MVSTDLQDQGIEPGDELNKVEMVSNRPTPDPGDEIEAESSDSVPSWPEPHRPRQRAHRRDHQLHQYEQSQRDAGGGSAGQESGANAA